MTALFKVKEFELNDVSFANFANQLMSKTAENGKRELAFPKLTTTKLRSIYGLIMNIYTRIDDAVAFERYKSDIQYLKVKMAYEAGKEAAVAEFLKKTFLMDAIGFIKTYEQFMLYCRYAESLVAYFKFYGGKDK